MKSKYDFSDMMPVAGKSEISEKLEKLEQEKKPNASKGNAERRPSYIPRTVAEQEIARDINIIEKGRQCEDDVFYALSYLPRNQFIVHKNIFVHGKNAIGQDEDQEHDFIVVCNNMIFDIEAKSISGNILTIDAKGQWKVQNNKRTFAMTSPSAQVERHRQNITYRMSKRFPDMEIIEIVVTNNDRLLIQDEYEKLNYYVTKTDTLVEFIRTRAGDCGTVGPITSLVNDTLFSGVRARRWR